MKNNTGAPSTHTKEDGEMPAPGLEILKAFDLNQYHYLYVIDLPSDELVYDSPKVLWGESRASGYRYVVEHIADEERMLYPEMQRAFRQALDTQPTSRMHTVSAVFTSHVFLGGVPMLVSFRLAPVVPPVGERVRLLAVMLSPAVNKQSGDFVFQSSEGRMKYSFVEHRWRPTEDKRCVPTPEERRMLVLAARGFTLQEIAYRMYRSIDTVKKYRGNLFRKFGVDNITSALYFALEHNLL